MEEPSHEETICIYHGVEYISLPYHIDTKYPLCYKFLELSQKKYD
jgi:hypothetical protein